MKKIKRILVTGAAGYMAGYFIEEAGRRFKGAAVTACDRIPPRGRPSESAGTRFIKCDFSSVEEAEKIVSRENPDLIVNLAGTGSATVLPWDVLVRANLMTSLAALEAAARAARGARVLLIGSAAEYGRIPADLLPADENLPLRPTGAYGMVKSWQTRAADYFAGRGADVVTARLFNVLGPGMSEQLSVGSFAAQIGRIKRGEGPPEIRAGDISVKRDFVDIRDAAAALCLIAAKGLSGRVYNVCSGKSRTLRKIIETFCSAAGTGIKIIREKSRLRANDVKDIRGSYSLLKKHTGWKPRYSIGETLDFILPRK